MFGHELHDEVSAVSGDESANKADTEEREIGETNIGGREVVRCGREDCVLKESNEGQTCCIEGVGNCGVDDDWEGNERKGLEGRAPEADFGDPTLKYRKALAVSLLDVGQDDFVNTERSLVKDHFSFAIPVEEKGLRDEEVHRGKKASIKEGANSKCELEA